ncbi:hypothetical protein GCM10027417_30270 [Glutamicibacter endophyticus]
MGMQITDLATALHRATEYPEHYTTSLGAVASHLHALTQINTYLTELPALLAMNTDPRAAALIALATERLANQLLRNQLHAAHQVEATAAHTLPSPVLDAMKHATGTITGKNGTTANNGDDRDSEEGMGRGGFGRVIELLQHPCEPVSGRPTYRDAASFLASWLNQDYFTAKTRVTDAHRLIARPTGTDIPAQPVFPELATHFTTSQDVRSVLNAARRLEKLTNPNTAPEGRTALGDTGLETQAANLLTEENPRTRTEGLNRFFRHAATTAQRSDPMSMTGLFRKGTQHGITTYVFKAAAEDSELIESLLGHVDHPKTQAHAHAVETAKATASRAGSMASASTSDDDLGAEGKNSGTGEVFPDFLTAEEAATARADTLDSPEPTVAQRRLAGLINLLRTQATPPTQTNPHAGTDTKENSVAEANTGEATQTSAGAGLGKPKGLFRPTIIVHMPLRELVDLAQSHGLPLPETSAAGAPPIIEGLPAVGGITAHGLAIDSGALRRMLCEANIIPLVLGGASEILDVGRSQRYFPTVMKRAILARDRGCIVPGCTVPAENCEIDHVQEWEHGGVTSVGNGATLHPGHHVDRHAGLFDVVMKDGIPWVRYPKHVDPEQRLRRNTINFTPR